MSFPPPPPPLSALGGVLGTAQQVLVWVGLGGGVWGGLGVTVLGGGGYCFSGPGGPFSGRPLSPSPRFGPPFRAPAQKPLSPPFGPLFRNPPLSQTHLLLLLLFRPRRPPPFAPPPFPAPLPLTFKDLEGAKDCLKQQRTSQNEQLK